MIRGPGVGSDVVRARLILCACASALVARASLIDVVESPLELGSGRSESLSNFSQGFSDYPRSLRAHNPDKPCYYHYRDHHRSDRPLDESHNLIDNAKLSKQKTAKPQQTTRQRYGKIR